MSETDIQILAAKMDAGFEKIYAKLDGFELRFSDHKTMCAGKFADIAIRLAGDRAMTMSDKESEKKRLEPWTWIIRGMTSVVALGAVTLIWKLITGTAKIIIGG